MLFPVHHKSLNQLWARVVVEALTRWGITDCCIAPGSRSAPLTLAFASQNKIRVHRHFDERGLGFLALGIAKASQGIVAIVTTSGTAVANLLPAVIEAAQTGQRLIVISADRPPRLHNCGANQSIEQIGLFGVYPRSHVNLLPPSVGVGVDQVLQQLHSGLQQIEDFLGGVFHLNMMFDDPLYPDPNADDCDYSDYLANVEAWRVGARQVSEGTDPTLSATPSALIDHDDLAFFSGPGLIVVGAIESLATVTAIKVLSERLGWPIIADIQSQLRFDSEVIGLADLLLTQEEYISAFQSYPKLLQIGGRLVSKRLQQFIDDHTWQQFWHVAANAYALVPGRNQHKFFCSDLTVWLEHCNEKIGSANTSITDLSSNKLQLLHANPLVAAQKQVQAQRDRYLSAQEQLTEVTLVAAALALLPAQASLFSGNSMSIRLLDILAVASTNSPWVFANRGASGIDGLLATIAGIAHAPAANPSSPIIALLGDTSALYDLNSLALLSTIKRPLVIIIINNDGGGIFKFLPVPDEQVRTDYYQMPHGLNFKHASAMFSLPYAQVDSLTEFKSELSRGLKKAGVSILEVITDAQQTYEQLESLKQACCTQFELSKK